ncbi:hypothetical protein [Streptomyces sp. NBC_01320]|uniref:hypothetical protein n=1 Tax=Streptomyces sp. NBC_01320 TaxID=2903824 RepID=UPI002E16364E|nr:hypothetical protein OG395_35790 [Streptomyces sp. NBC_01320]
MQTGVRAGLHLALAGQLVMANQLVQLTAPLTYRSKYPFDEPVRLPLPCLVTVTTHADPAHP